MKSGNLNFLEPSGPLQACDGTALPAFVPILSQTNTVNTLPNIFNFYFYFILSSLPGLRSGIFEEISHQKLHDTWALRSPATLRSIDW